MNFVSQTKRTKFSRIVNELDSENPTPPEPLLANQLAYQINIRVTGAKRSTLKWIPVFGWLAGISGRALDPDYAAKAEDFDGYLADVLIDWAAYAEYPSTPFSPTFKLRAKTGGNIITSYALA